MGGDGFRFGGDGRCNSADHHGIQFLPRQDINALPVSSAISSGAAVEGQKSPRGPYDTKHAYRQTKCLCKPTCGQLTHPLDVCFTMS